MEENRMNQKIEEKDLEKVTGGEFRLYSADELCVQGERSGMKCRDCEKMTLGDVKRCSHCGSKNVFVYPFC